MGQLCCIDSSRKAKKRLISSLSWSCCVVCLDKTAGGSGGGGGGGGCESAAGCHKNLNTKNSNRNGAMTIDRQSRGGVWIVFEYLPFDLLGFLDAIRDSKERREKYHRPQTVRNNKKRRKERKQDTTHWPSWEHFLPPSFFFFVVFMAPWACTTRLLFLPVILNCFVPLASTREKEK